MNEKCTQMKHNLTKTDDKEKDNDMEKMIEEIEQKAFMAGYEYAIEVLKAGRVKK